MEHLSLEIFDLDGKGSQYAYLPEDASITLTDTSEVFDSGNVWSLPFTLNIAANAKIFGTSGDMHGSRLHEQIHGRRARLWVDGLPLYLGYLRLDDEVDVDGEVEVTFESGQKTFDELIEGGKANQVPMMSDIQIGMALWRKRWACVEAELAAMVTLKNGTTFNATTLTHEVGSGIGDESSSLTPLISDGEDDGASIQPYPRMVFPKGDFYNTDTRSEESIDCLNTDTPYDDSHPYCNIALCYQKSGYTVTTASNGTKTTRDDYTAEPTAQRGYEVMPANRVNSAPNFFVIYWIRALMKHLGIYIEENQMMDVEDLRRLFFVNTNCAYEEIQYLRNSDKYDGSLGKYQFSDKGRLLAEYFGELVDERDSSRNVMKRWDGVKKIIKPEESSFECKSYTVKEQDYDVVKAWGEIDHIDIKVKSIAGISEVTRPYYDGYGHNAGRILQKNMLLHRAIATSECFPNVDISEVISALENGFGVRFLFDSGYQRVRIVLLRNIFRSEDVQDINCETLDESKTENCIRGFRLTYGDSDDTQFYYKGFADLLPHIKELWVDNSDKHDYSRWKLDEQYSDLIRKISALDTTCYVTPKNGNAYGIKIDENATRYDEAYPSLFEYAGYMDAEDGDCTGEDETIKEINVGFKPAIMNDTNFENERKDANVTEQRYALFVDEDMRPRRPDLGDLPNEETQPGVKSYDDSNAVYDTDKLYALHGNNGTEVKMVSDGVVTPGSFCVASDMYVEKEFTNVKVVDLGSIDLILSNLKIGGCVNEGYRLYLQDNFEPNDDGICPVETHDWGLTLGIMRGSGSDAYVNYSGDPDDEEGNDTWDVVPGSNATAHTDTCDSYGNLWDYNGSDGATLHCKTAEEAISALQKLWTKSNISLVYSSGTTYRDSSTYIWQVTIRTVKDINGDSVNLMFAYILGNATRPWAGGTTRGITRYAKQFNGMSIADMYTFDANNNNILIEAGSSYERADTLVALERLAFNNGSEVIIDGGDNGVGVTNGRFSLKLRAEKLNPYYGSSRTDVDTKNRYLTIEDKNLRGRGLCDQFYKEYSYWVRNARIANLEEKMELAQFLSIDKTKRVHIGDYIGFIKKMEFKVSNKTGLGNVSIELMYL